MVRVNHPPGGETKLNDEVSPDNLTVRVLKPPGGGSSIVFGEDDSPLRPKPLPKQEAPQEEKQEQTPKAEINGTATPQSVNDDAAATKENNPSAATNGSVTNGATTNGSATNGATTNGSATNGTVSSGSPSSRSSNSASTPTSAKQLDTQNRLFGNEPTQNTPNRRVRDHHRSNIFTSEEPLAKQNGTSNGPRAVFCGTWTRRDPVTGVGVLCWDIHAPRFAPNKRKASNAVVNENVEVKTPEQPQPQQKQRQRIPPGGFSTQLW